MGGGLSTEDRWLQLELDKEKTKQEADAEQTKRKQKQIEKTKQLQLIWVLNEIPSEKQGGVLKLLQEHLKEKECSRQLTVCMTT